MSGVFLQVLIATSAIVAVYLRSEICETSFSLPPWLAGEEEKEPEDDTGSSAQLQLDPRRLLPQSLACAAASLRAATSSRDGHTTSLSYFTGRSPPLTLLSLSLPSHTDLRAR